MLNKDTDHNKFYGMYRGEVIANDDRKWNADVHSGRIKVFVPSVYPPVFFEQGNIAYPVHFAMVQTKRGWSADHEMQSVIFKSENVSIKVDERPNDDGGKGMCCTSNTDENTKASQAEIAEQGTGTMTTRMKLDITNNRKDCALELNITGVVNLNIDGDVYKHHYGDYHETHIGNKYIHHRGAHHEEIEGEMYRKRVFADSPTDVAITDIVHGNINKTVKGDISHWTTGNQELKVNGMRDTTIQKANRNNYMGGLYEVVKKGWCALLASKLFKVTTNVSESTMQSFSANFTEVEANESAVTTGDTVEEIDTNESIIIHQNRDVTIHMNDTETVAMDQTNTVSMNQVNNIGINQTSVVGVNKLSTVGGVTSALSGGDYTVVASTINLN
jgi:hypothetical protein